MNSERRDSTESHTFVCDVGQRIVIDDAVVVAIVAISGGVKLGFEASSDTSIRRDEIRYPALARH